MTAALKTSSDASLVSLVQRKRVLVVAGAGGVGKTTVAAALGLLGAQQGKRSLVLTIDPARRLAVALGLERLEHAPREVQSDELADQGVRPGLLHASMLDQKRAFDHVIERYATDPETCRRVLDNKLYRELSTRLAGGQEYAAMEQLYATALGGEFDLIVLDTPPTANAVDFLEAPQKIVALLTGPAVTLFVRSYRQVGRFSFKLLTIGTAYVFKRLARFVGGRFLDDVASFFGDMEQLLAGFKDRAAAVVELLRGQDTGFVLVTSPEPRAIDEAIALRQRLDEDGMHAMAFVINRVHPQCNIELTLPQVTADLKARQLAQTQASEAAALLLRSHEQLQALADANAAQIERLQRSSEPALPCLQVPLLDGDVHDLQPLAEISRYLAG